MKFKHFLKEQSEKKFWYHGDANEFNNFNHFRMDRDPAMEQSELRDGPGIYFTESMHEAMDYAEPDGYIYRVELEGNIVDEFHTLSEEMALQLIKWAPEEKHEELAQEYIDDAINSYEYDDEDDAIEAGQREYQDSLIEDAKEFARHGQNNWTAPIVNLYKKYYGNEYASDFTSSLVSLDIDGFKADFNGRDHVIMYNPKKIGVWEVEPYSVAYERRYGEDY